MNDYKRVLEKRKQFHRGGAGSHCGLARGKYQAEEAALHITGPEQLPGWELRGVTTSCDHWL